MLPDIFREGDFVETPEGFIFDVKGLVHPPDRVVAFIRYVPNPSGSRRRLDVRYMKIYDLAERQAFLERTASQYLVYDPVFDENLSEVPRPSVVRHYKPLERVRELLKNPSSSLEQKVAEMITSLASASSIPREEFGVSGSILVGLAGPESDIDIVVYGSDRCRRVRESLADLLREGREYEPYGEERVRLLHNSRHMKTGVPFVDYARSELRKDFQGYFRGTDFFIRYVKDVCEVDEEYGSTKYKTLGYVKAEALISADDEAIFTPCTYSIRDAQLTGSPCESLTEIASFRGQFCEQASKGERVVAQGKLEGVARINNAFKRLLLGNSPRDFMVSYPPHGTVE